MIRNATQDITENEKKNNTYQCQLQYKKIRPKNNSKKNNYYLYIHNKQMIESISDDNIQKNYGTAEEYTLNNDTKIVNKDKYVNRINKIKRVNSFLLGNRAQINELKQNNN